jgi:phosphoglucosamine mutase
MSQASARKLFGTDGVRGIANQDPMTAEMALRLGQAVARRFRHPARPGRIVIGKDTRLSGYMLESALQAGIVSAGADVMLVGPLPTPGIAFITSSMRADAGVVISASHNPFQDNGIKIFAADGFKLPDDVELGLEGAMSDIEAGKFGEYRAAPDAIGKAVRIEDAGGRYVQFLKHAYPKERTLDGLKIVVDCANGAAYHVAPQVFDELGADVVALGVTPDGRNINDGTTVAARFTRSTWRRRFAAKALTWVSRWTAMPIV